MEVKMAEITGILLGYIYSPAWPSRNSSFLEVFLAAIMCMQTKHTNLS